MDLLNIARRMQVDPDPEIVGLIERVLRPVTDIYFQTKIVGAEHLPEEGALLVSNHGLYAYDAAILFFKFFHETGRVVRPLADNNLFRLPIVRQTLALFGVVHGNKQNAAKLLREGELVLVFPGGAREALVKTQESRYHLYWDDVYGFVEVALMAERPLVPVVGIGPDDAFIIVADHNQISAGPLGEIIRTIFGNDKYIPSVAVGPGFLPLPLPVPFTYYIGEPFHMPYPPEAAKDKALVMRLQQEFKARMESLIDYGLAQRS